MTGSMIPWTTSNTLTDFRREMDDLMNRLFSLENDGGSPGRFTPFVNVSETESEYQVSLDLPGVSPDDVHVEMRHGDLWISGERKHEDEKKDAKFHRIERHYGSFQRVIRLGDDVNPDGVDAQYRDGVLHVSIPKSEAAKPKRIEIRK